MGEGGRRVGAVVGVGNFYSFIYEKMTLGVNEINCGLLFPIIMIIDSFILVHTHTHSFLRFR